jgi:DNA invertase Pin-like site-specific DNA recombinase
MARKPTTRKPRCFLYGRMSTRKQERGDSARRQQALADSFCHRHQLEQDTELKLWDVGVSGWKGKNLKRNLGVLLKAIEQGRIKPGDYILIEKTDRLTRDELIPALNLFNEIISAGVFVAELEPETIYDKQSLKGYNIMMLVSKSITSNDYSERLSTRIKATYDARRQAHELISYVLPGWLRRNGQDLEVIPQELEKIKLIYRLALEGNGARSIWQHLTENKIKSMKGGRWHIANVQRLLLDRRLIGEFKTKTGHHDDNYFPVVIPETDFYRVQQLIAARRKRKCRTQKRVANLFTGLLFDADSKSPMILHLLKASNHKYALLVSQAGLDKTADFTTVNIYPVEHAILDHVQTLTSADFVVSTNTDDELETLLAKLAKVEHQLSNYQTAFDTKPIDEVLPILERLGEQKRNLNRQIDDCRMSRAKDPNDDLGTIHKSLIEMLDCSPEDMANIREKIKSKLPSVIERVDMLIVKCSHLRRRVHFDLHTTSGKRLSFAIDVQRGQLVSMSDETREPLNKKTIAQLKKVPWQHKTGPLDHGKPVKW